MDVCTHTHTCIWVPSYRNGEMNYTDDSGDRYSKPTKRPAADMIDGEFF